MIRLRSALFWLALLLVTPPYSMLVLACAPLPRMTRYRVISGWAWLMLWCLRGLCGIRWRVEGREHLPTVPAVILAKHQSAWETLAFQQIFPPQVQVLKRELLWLPFFGWGLALMSPIPIDRGKGLSALRQMARRGQARLRQGFWVLVFPEGTRVRPGTRRRYQLGGAWLAAHTGAPVVPVAHNAGRFWPRNSFLKYPGVVRMRIGPAIESAGRDAETINRMAEEWIETQQKILDS
ncbi:MAG: 1-acyl-sn-glycerol-3-phosphate acyltransferase [Burkholderiales bacterium]|nr:1-acyl-sn-glycerol-3-phosphate acyltransferase [Burkholderiales bacterium]